MKKTITRSETYRYLGYGNKIPDEKIISLVNECEEELIPFIAPRNIYDLFEIRRNFSGTVETDVMSISSKALSRNLTGCRAVFMVGATLGSRVDLLLQKYSRLSPGRALVIQALAAAAMEDYMDSVEESIRSTLEKGEYLRPRFSPGYADLSLEYQKNIFAVLDLPKKIGATLMDNLVMAPSKTVTAFIGLCEDSPSVYKANQIDEGKENEDS